MTLNNLILILLFTLLTAGCSAPEKVNEKWFQQRWCEQQDGQVEVRLIDNTRCDCLTNSHAIEVDFSHKWAEAIGQSLHYAKMTGMKAGILLIVENTNDKKHLARLESVVQFHNLPITVWTTKQSHLN